MFEAIAKHNVHVGVSNEHVKEPDVHACIYQLALVCEIKLVSFLGIYIYIYMDHY